MFMIEIKHLLVKMYLWMDLDKGALLSSCEAPELKTESQSPSSGTGIALDRRQWPHSWGHSSLMESWDSIHSQGTSVRGFQSGASSQRAQDRGLRSGASSQGYPVIDPQSRASSQRPLLWDWPGWLRRVSSSSFATTILSLSALSITNMMAWPSL